MTTTPNAPDTTDDADDVVVNLPTQLAPLIFLDAIPPVEWRRPGRAILLISSGVSVTRAQSARVQARPSTLAFLPDRIVIGGESSDWLIHDILVGGRSQLRASSIDGSDLPGIPGELIARGATYDLVEFETVQSPQVLTFVVSYVGTSDGGAPFCCVVIGSAA